MTQHFMFAKPRFTARTVAKVFEKALGRNLTFEEADDLEDVDGSVHVSSRVHVQVGADYLVVCAWQDETTLRSWPPRPNIPYALKDLRTALEQCPEPNT